MGFSGDATKRAALQRRQACFRKLPLQAADTWSGRRADGSGKVRCPDPHDMHCEV
jgi:hypothetical protein